MIKPPSPTSPVRPLSAAQRKRRQGILDATNDLLARVGYEGLSMKAIAAQAGVAERTLFNIYSTKDALVAISARERTHDIVSEAWDLAPDRSLGFFRSLTRTLARRTLDAPDVARALAPVLTRHADLVDLDQVYDRFVGQTLRHLADGGQLDARHVAGLSRLIAMRMVSTVNLWAGGTIADRLLEAHMRLALAEVLLPHAADPLRAWAQSEASACFQQISSAWPAFVQS